MTLHGPDTWTQTQNQTAEVSASCGVLNLTLPLADSEPTALGPKMKMRTIRNVSELKVQALLSGSGWSHQSNSM